MPTLTADEAEVRELGLFVVKRLSLWLAVGNAGGLIALGSQVIEFVDKPVAALLLPSLWAFSIGLVGAFLLQAAIAMSFAEAQENSPWIDALGIGSLATASLGFLIGVFYPLTTASLTLFRLG